MFCIWTKGIAEQPPPIQGNTNRRSVSTLRPSAKDAYMLFQVSPPGGSSPPSTSLSGVFEIICNLKKEVKMSNFIIIIMWILKLLVLSEFPQWLLVF